MGNRTWLWVLVLCQACLGGGSGGGGGGATTAAAASALTESVDFDGGSVKNGDIPAADDESVVITPVNSSILVSPGDTGVIMEVDVDNADEDTDPVAATLIRFEDTNKHIEVLAQNKMTTVGAQTRVQNSFDVDEGVCDDLCNQQYSIQVTETSKLESGKIGGRSTRTLRLDCTVMGNPARCPKAPSTGGANCAQFESKLRQCSLLSAGTWDCEEPVGESENCQAQCVLAADCAGLESLLCSGFADPVGPLAACMAGCTGPDFVCDNGDTYPADFQCDGFDDCGDNSDEVGCGVDVVFTCDNGDTYPLDYQCDGYDDCGDNSDEVGCDAGAVFTCANGETVPASYKCDGGADCSDASDEAGCAMLLCGGEVAGTAGGI